MDTLKECQIMINNIIQDTLVILKRPDPKTKQALISSTIEFNEKLLFLNAETLSILNDKSWRERK